MHLSNVLVVLCLAAGMTSFSSYSGSRKESPVNRKTESGMHAVAVHPKVGSPGRGWRYFTDVRDGRAVVISPRGNYYYSQGEGLKLVYKSAVA